MKASKLIKILGTCMLAISLELPVLAAEVDGVSNVASAEVQVEGNEVSQTESENISVEGENTEEINESEQIETEDADDLNKSEQTEPESGNVEENTNNVEDAGQIESGNSSEVGENTDNANESDEKVDNEVNVDDENVETEDEDINIDNKSESDEELEDAEIESDNSADADKDEMDNTDVNTEGEIEKEDAIEEEETIVDLIESEKKEETLVDVQEEMSEDEQMSLVGTLDGQTLIINLGDFEGDNSTKIQEALNLANQEIVYRNNTTAEGYVDGMVQVENVRVIIPAGTYNLLGALELFSDTEFALEDGAIVVGSHGRTLLQGEHSASINGGSWVVDNNSIADGTITKLTVSNSQFTSDNGSELSLGNVGMFSIMDCEFNNVALKMGEESDALVTGNFIIADGTAVISGNTINNGAGGFGIYVGSQYSNVQVSNNTINNVSGAGIQIWGTGSKVKDNVISGCTIGIQTMNAGSLAITGNQIDSSGSHGILVENADTANISSNTINGGSQQGINVSNSSHISISGNEVKNIQNHGVLVTNNATDVAVENNIVQGCTMGIYLNAIPQVVVKSNTITSSANSALLCMNSSGLKADGNNISGSSQNGIYFDNCENAIVKNNKVKENGMNGMVIIGCAKTKINNNTTENNALEGLHLENSDGAVIDNNAASGNASNGFGITRSANVVIEANQTNTNGHYGIIVTGNGGNGNVINNSKAYIRNNSVYGDCLTGIEVTGATAEISGNTVKATGASGGEGIVVVYSADSWIMNNTIMDVKAAQPGVIGNGIIVADQSKKCYIYKNTVQNCGNHGIQVTYAATDITTLGNSVAGSGNQGITYSRNASGSIAGNQVLHSGNHNIINEAATVKVGGNYVEGGGKIESIAFNSGCKGTAKGNIIVGTKYKLFVNASTIEQSDNTILASAPATNPYKEVGNVENFVKRLYNKVLKRNAENAGLADWTSYLLCREITGAEAASGFFFSEEYKAKNVSDEQFVDTLYDAMFNSKGDAEGRKFWLNDLETGFSRTYLMWGFAESVQFDNLCNQYGITRGTITLVEPRDKNRGVTQFVSRIYRKALNRGVDAPGLNTWCDEIISGRQTPAQVVSGFIFSREFIERNLSDEDFIEVMYATYFDRSADAPGMKTWKDMLKKNPDRTNVVGGFNGSKEFFDLVARFGL